MSRSEPRRRHRLALMVGIQLVNAPGGSLSTIFRDLTAGMVVFLVALPLYLGIVGGVVTGIELSWRGRNTPRSGECGRKLRPRRSRPQRRLAWPPATERTPWLSALPSSSSGRWPCTTCQAGDGLSGLTLISPAWINCRNTIRWANATHGETEALLSDLSFTTCTDILT